MLSILPLPLVIRSLFVVLPALGILEGLPVCAPGEVPGATVCAKAAPVESAKAAKIKRDFME